MQRIDRLLIRAGKTVESIIPRIMAVFIKERGGEWYNTTCYYKNEDGYSEVEVYKNKSEALKGAESKKAGKSFPVIHFVKASTIFKERK